MTDREKLIELLVEAESLCAAIDCYDGAVCEYAGEVNGCTAFRADHLIANGVVVREKGEWVPLGQRTYGGGRSYTHYCRQCGQHGYDDYTLCPNCGADMRKGEKG